jgi:hypothetical protein
MNAERRRPSEMAQHIVRQPNGRYAIFSSIVDDFISYDATAEECYAHFRQEAIINADRRTTRSLEIANTSETQFIDDIRRIRSIHGDQQADESLIRAMTESQ